MAGCDDLVLALDQIEGVLDAEKVGAGQLRHSIEQLSLFLEARAGTRIPEASPELETRFQAASARFVDVVVRGVHNEMKTGLNLGDALNLTQIENDVRLAASHGIENVWHLTNPNIDFNTPETVRVIMERMRQVRDQLPEALRDSLASFNFKDRAGNLIKTELDENGDLIFRDAMDVIFGADGKITQAATEGATSSPNFEPAMQALFGASGKVADAATAAAQGANLEPALENLEDKIETGVAGAMDEAGDAVAAHGASELGSRIAGGATALGNILTSVPAMAQSVTALGAAWNQPLDSTEAYMNLFSAAGNTINQGVQTFQALAGVTQIASAAQGVFNAVMAMNPIVLIVIAVIALIAAIALLIIYWDEVKAVVRDNPWLPLLLVLMGPLGIIIGLVILIAAHWEEVKLAVLQAANFISIQLQRIGQFFVGVFNLAGQVWDAIVATAVNAGIGIANAFISVGTEIQNFFIGVINGILSMYNEVATSAIGEFVGLEPAELIPEVDVETRLIPPREVPEINVAAAFDAGPVTGGLEDMIAEQENAVAAARAEDEARRAAAEAPPAAGSAGPGAALPGAPALPTGLPAAPPALPSAPAGALAPPVLPAGVGAPGGGAGSIDASVTVQGGITVNINAERLEADAAQLLSDEIIAQLQARLGSLRSEQDFRTGVR